jgi:hypothetical protein
MKSLHCRPVFSWFLVAILQISSFSAAFTTNRKVRIIVTPPTLASSPQQPYQWKRASSPLHRTTGMPVVPRYYSNLPVMPLFMTSTSGEDKGDDEAPTTTQVEVSRFKKIRQLLFPPKKDADGLTTTQKLAKMGMSVLLSYGFVSNMSYSVTISLAWFIFSKRTGMVRSHKMLRTECYSPKSHPLYLHFCCPPPLSTTTHTHT